MILLYHRIFPDSTSKQQWYSGPVMRFSDFKNQMNWLQKHFTIVPLSEIVRLKKEGKREPGKLIAITFDDGFQSYYDFLIPYLEENQIPATFFITTGHLLDGELAWFSYLNALCFERVYKSIVINHKEYNLTKLGLCRKARRTIGNYIKQIGQPHSYCEKLADLYPIPTAIKNGYLGFSEKQIAELGSSNFLDVGGHTIFHPYLNSINVGEQFSEINGNKLMLEKITQKNIRYFAYPSGEYNKSSIKIINESGYDAGFVVKSKNLSDHSIFEIDRIGIYSTSTIKLCVKVSGFTEFARKFGFKIG